MAKYDRPKEGEWWAAGALFRLACCDCGLVHDFEMRVLSDGEVELRGSRNERSTGQIRRHMRKEK